MKMDKDRLIAFLRLQSQIMVAKKDKNIVQ